MIPEFKSRKRTIFARFLSFFSKWSRNRPKQEQMTGDFHLPEICPESEK
jgi:hypothetical protein